MKPKALLTMRVLDREGSGQEGPTLLSRCTPTKSPGHGAALSPLLRADERELYSVSISWRLIL